MASASHFHFVFAVHATKGGGGKKKGKEFIRCPIINQLLDRQDRLDRLTLYSRPINQSFFFFFFFFCLPSLILINYYEAAAATAAAIVYEIKEDVDLFFESEKKEKNIMVRKCHDVVETSDSQCVPVPNPLRL